MDAAEQGDGPWTGVGGGGGGGVPHLGAATDMGGMAVQVRCWPGRAMPRWLPFKARVVNPVALAGRVARQPYPQAVSARATAAAAWRWPAPGTRCESVTVKVANVVKGRFARDASEFAPRKKAAR